MNISRITTLVLITLLIPLLSFCQENAAPATLILVRHAEKAAEPAQDPPLTEKGKQRAELLAAMLKEAGVEAIYSTPYLRNTETVGPAAKSLNLKVNEYDPRQDASEFLNGILKNHAGEVVLICGHSNTVPVMLNRLTNTENYQQMDEMEYEDVFIVNVSALGKATVINLNIEP